MTGAAAAGLRWFDNATSGPGPLSVARAILIPRGTTTQIADVLVADGAVGNAWLFRAAALATSADGSLHAAEFAFPAHASVLQVLGILRTGRPVEHHLTIAEGLTAQQILGVLGRADAMDGEVKTLDEGSILPETYEYEYGTERSVLLARAKAAMDRHLASAWAERASGLSVVSPREALILASIVERETARPEERPHVAAVYMNRLRLGMKLQADPTVAYMASGGSGVLDHKLNRAELGRDDPYNTYRVTGLPPGPICAPGLESLHAVLHPAASDDLYFVADGTGGHVFSRTYQDHDTAVARWRALGSPGQHGSPD